MRALDLFCGGGGASDGLARAGFRVTGVTTTGRATVDALKLNRGTMLAIRSEEAYFGRFPTTTAG